MVLLFEFRANISLIILEYFYPKIVPKLYKLHLKGSIYYYFLLSSKFEIILAINIAISENSLMKLNKKKKKISLLIFQNFI